MPHWLIFRAIWVLQPMMNIRTLICIAGISCPFPVESLLATEAAEAGVPQSCRKILLFCSAQVREDKTSLLFVIMVNKHLLTG